MLLINDLSFKYDTNFGLENLNLKLDKGQIYSILGQSGSGKSTLLKLIAGLLDPLSGEIHLDHEKIKGPAFKLVPGHVSIKLMTQANTLFPNISIKENIMYELRKFKPEYQEKRSTYLAKHFGISDLLDKTPRELSGGELQRAMLAKALADEPKLLLLDEPFANLDIITKKKVGIFLKKILKKEKIACIWVTHDLSDAYGNADTIILMNKGKIQESYTPENLYFRPKTKFAAAISGDYFSFEKRYLRPEHIILAEAGEFLGTVTENIFRGSHYEVFLKTESHDLFFKSIKPYLEGKKVKFNLL